LAQNQAATITTDAIFCVGIIYGAFLTRIAPLSVAVVRYNSRGRVDDPNAAEERSEPAAELVVVDRSSAGPTGVELRHFAVEVDKSFSNFKPFILICREKCRVSEALEDHSQLPSQVV
jgi:hypothetical protein